MTLLNVFLCFCPIFLMVLRMGSSCSPGPRYNYRYHSSRDLAPLVKGQFVPNLSENTIGASGPKEGEIEIGSSAFFDLVQNFNPLIEFDDRRGNGYERWMTQRCKDRVDTLAMLVVNVWPTVKLRVTRAWSKSGSGSLHQEGRAVDFSTSDKDKKKYGVLARLAVEAGFDWVHYKSRSYIHASVRSDKSTSSKFGGCFPGDSLVYPESGNPIPLRSLSVGERVLASDRHSGQLVYSEVILMLDRLVNVSSEFIEIKSEFETLTTSKHHIVFIARRFNIESNQTSFISMYQMSFPVYAEDVKPGDFVFAYKPSVIHSDSLSPSRVISVKSVVRKGVIAPLTKHGTLIVDSNLVSCYSSFFSESLAHAVFWPMRMFKFLRSTNQHNGVHWYPSLLCSLVKYFLPSNYFRF